MLAIGGSSPEVEGHFVHRRVLDHADDQQVAPAAEPVARIADAHRAPQIESEGLGLEPHPEGVAVGAVQRQPAGRLGGGRSEEHTSELQSLMRISYAVFCLKKKRNTRQSQK